MKLLLALVIMLPMSSFCGDVDVKAFYDVWYAKYGEESIRKFSPVFDDRNDPPYLSWKQARQRFALYDGFTHAENWYREQMPVEWKQFEKSGGSYDKLSDWAWRNLWPWSDGKPVHKSSYDYPPPANWVSTKVNNQGVAVDKEGKASHLAYGPNWFKFFWIPMLLGIVAGLWALSKGFGNNRAGLAFVGTLVAYGYLTDPWSVFECFFSVYVVLILAAVAIFRMILSGILSGLGFKK